MTSGGQLSIRVDNHRESLMESDEYTEELHSHYCDGEFLDRLKALPGAEKH